MIIGCLFARNRCQQLLLHFAVQRCVPAQLFERDPVVVCVTLSHWHDAHCGPLLGPSSEWGNAVLLKSHRSKLHHACSIHEPSSFSQTNLCTGGVKYPVRGPTPKSLQATEICGSFVKSDCESALKEASPYFRRAYSK